MSSFHSGITALALAGSLCGCAQAQLVDQRYSDRAQYHVMSDMTGTIGAFAVVPEANTQRPIRNSPPEVVNAMLAMSWLGATEPAGTFLVWSDKVPSLPFTPTLVMQLQGDVNNSGGCEVVDWHAMEDVTDRRGMLASMDGSQGGGDYMLSLGERYTAHQRSSGSGDIILCPTQDPAKVEVYGMDHDPRTIADLHDPKNFIFAGTFTVNLPEVKKWIYTNGTAGHFIIKGAKAPPVGSWDGPLPIPAARQQELAAGK